MKFLYEYPLQITTLTPVHIGCGEDYTPTDYVIENETLYAFDTSAISEGLPEIGRQQLMKLVSGNPAKDQIILIQNLFYQYREALLTRASHYLPVANGVHDLYKKRIGQVAQREESGKRVVNRLEIERTFYNPYDQQPVIPGSSLKGAIRTALLNSINKGEPFTNEEARREKNANAMLQKRLFKYNNLEDDPMRLIHVDDTHSVHNDGCHTEIRFAVNRPRNETKPGQTKRSMAEDKGLYQLLETLPELDVRKFQSRLMIQDVKSIKQTDKLSEKQHHWTIEQIVRSCNQFYSPLLSQELRTVSQRNYVAPEWKQRMKKLLDGIKPLLLSNNAMLLRVGRHSGAEAVTLNGVRNIKINLGKDKSGKNKYEYKAEPRTLWLAADAEASRSEMTPFGWVLIEINPSEQPLTILDEIDKQSNDQKRQRHQKQQERVAELRRELYRENLQKEQDKQKQQAKEAAKLKEQERLAEEAKKREERAKADKVRLDALPEHRRLVELLDKSMKKLQSLYEELKKDVPIEHVLKTYPSTSPIIKERDNVKQLGSKLMSESTKIPANDRNEVAVLLGSAYELIGWHETGANKKQKTKQEKKKRDAIDRIRNG